MILFSGWQVSRDEIRRMKEKLAKSEKANKSRQEIEEHLRQRAEKAEKKGKALDQKVKSLRAVSFAHSSLECAPGIFGGVGGAGDGAGDAGALQKKVQTLEAARESDRKQLSRKLREQEKVVKELRQALERKDQEVRAFASPSVPVTSPTSSFFHLYFLARRPSSMLQPDAPVARVKHISSISGLFPARAAYSALSY